MTIDDLILTFANATNINVTDRAVITFQIQGVTYVQRVYLIRNLACEFLEGNDFLVANKTVINFNERYVQFGKNQKIHNVHL